MPLQFVSGDPLMADAPVLAIDHNIRGRQELDEFHAHLLRLYPPAFSSYTRACRKGRVKIGKAWTWHESKPRLLFWPLRESPFGATRLRYVQSIAMQIARDYRLEGLKALTIGPLGRPHERDEIHKVLEMWLKRVPIDITVYTDYVPDPAA